MKNKLKDVDSQYLIMKENYNEFFNQFKDFLIKNENELK
jgi:hypothetical protein